jgi:hypothetical protein
MSLAAYAEEPTIKETEIPGGWSKAKASGWYAEQRWPCGFNYIPANAISYTEMWMPYCFDAGFIDRELALAEAIGFNCLRVVLPFVVWEHDPEAFKGRLETFVDVCDKRGVKAASGRLWHRGNTPRDYRNQRGYVRHYEKHVLNTLFDELSWMRPAEEYDRQGRGSLRRCENGGTVNGPDRCIAFPG